MSPMDRHVEWGILEETDQQTADRIEAAIAAEFRDDDHRLRLALRHAETALHDGVVYDAKSISEACVALVIGRIMGPMRRVRMASRIVAREIHRSLDQMIERPPIAQTLSTLLETLHNFLRDRGLRASMMVGLIDLPTRRMDYCCIGTERPALFAHASGWVRPEQTGHHLGVDPYLGTHLRSLQLSEGRWIICPPSVLPALGAGDYEWPALSSSEARSQFMLSIDRHADAIRDQLDQDAVMAGQPWAFFVCEFATPCRTKSVAAPAQFAMENLMLPAPEMGTNCLYYG